MQKNQKKETTAGTPKKQSAKTSPSRTTGTRRTGQTAPGSRTDSRTDSRVRLTAAEWSGKKSGESAGAEKNTERRTVTHTSGKAVVRQTKTGSGAAKKPEDRGQADKPKKKVYAPPSSAPIHQVLPYVFLVFGIFFGVCFVLFAVNLNRAGEVIGSVGEGLCRVFFGVFGYGAFTFPILLLSLAVLWRKTVDNGTLGVRLLLTFLTSAVLSAYVHILLVSSRPGYVPTYSISWLYQEGALIGGGGVIGGVLGQALYNGLRLVGSSILCIGALILLCMFLCGVTPVYVWTSIRYRVRRSREKHAQAMETRREIAENQKLADAVLSGGLDPEPGKNRRRPKETPAGAEERASEQNSDSAGRAQESVDPKAAEKRNKSEEKNEKPRHKKAFIDEEEIMPVFTDESIPHEDPDTDLDNIPGMTELNMSAIYEASALREEIRRNDEANSIAKANGFTATDWMRASNTEGASDAPAAGNFRSASAVPGGASARSGFMDLEDEPAGADTAGSAVTDSDATDFIVEEDDRIRELLNSEKKTPGATATVPPVRSAEKIREDQPLDIPVKKSMSEADEYLPEDTEISVSAPEEPEVPEEHPYVSPPITLLNQGDISARITTEEVERNMQTLKAVLKSFNINIKEMAYSCGPTITRYEVRPESGTRVRQFTLLSDDIALGLAAKSGIRIEAPIPGKPAVGIEVPNDNPATVWLRSLIDTPDFYSGKGTLPVCLGADISGKGVLLDIVKMPHLLIAGATGMGKSVCINCLVTSLMYRYSPAEVRLIMVDPKQVEFVPYKDIPHLFVPIITDPKAATAALAAAIDEMEDRFSKIKDVGARDIRGYNDIAAMDPDLKKLPYLVIIIDELADLMMTASDEVETSICRLAQKARAAGIHLIIGTQRPSVDVVKGTIKSNIPSRIAFTVASQVDSKTILDSAGAEKLIGRGDMIYAPVGAMKPIRVQGAFVSDKEVENISDFVKKNNDPVKYDEQFMKRMTEAAARVGAKKNEGLETDGDTAIPSGGDDDKLTAALEVIYDTGRASTSLLQRKLQIGYGRAAKILDVLEEQGFIGPQEGSKPRAILISHQDYMERYLNGYDSKNGGDSERDSDFTDDEL